MSHHAVGLGDTELSHYLGDQPCPSLPPFQLFRPFKVSTDYHTIIEGLKPWPLDMAARFPAINGTLSLNVHNFT